MIFARRLVPSSTGRRTLLCVLAFALWFAAALGTAHRTMHLPDAGHATLATVVAGDTVDGKQGWSTLFGAHSDADCRLYDQLSHGGAVPCIPASILPVMLPTARFAFLEGEVLARWVALFDARGPPSVR